MICIIPHVMSHAIRHWVWVLLGISALSTEAALWTAVNDQGSTTNTHPNATRYHALGLEDGASGPLRNILTGAALEATLTITRTGLVAGDLGYAEPPLGSPLSDVFDGLVDFATSRDNVGIGTIGSATFDFTSLDATCAYQVQAGAVRGNDLFTNRWSLVELIGADSFLHGHSPGVLTTNEVPSLAPNQVAVNFGANHTPGAGDLINFFVLDTGADGGFTLRFTKYSGEVPGGSSAGNAGYLPSALRVFGFINETQIQIVQPPQPQAVLLGEPAEFSVAAAGFPVLYQWYRDGVEIPGATESSYGIDATSEADQGAAFSVRAYNNDTSETSAPAILTILLPPETVVPYEQVWRYDARGENLGTAWREPGYDDSDWPSGPGPLGFPASEPTPVPLATVFPNNGDITYYFRTRFVFDGEPADTDLVFTNFFDDAAVVYLNGTEMLRTNLPPGEVTFETEAIMTGEWWLFDRYVPGDLLVRGTNMLAVEVHQFEGTSSDLIIGLHLLAGSAAPTPLAITNQPLSLTVEEPQTASFTVGVEGRRARFQWFKNGLPIPGETRDTLVFTEARPADAANYVVVVSNVLDVLISDTITLTVLPDVTPPELVEAVTTQTPDGETFNAQLLRGGRGCARFMGREQFQKEQGALHVPQPLTRYADARSRMGPPPDVGGYFFAASRQNPPPDVGGYLVADITTEPIASRRWLRLGFLFHQTHAVEAAEDAGVRGIQGRGRAMSGVGHFAQRHPDFAVQSILELKLVAFSWRGRPDEHNRVSSEAIQGQDLEHGPGIGGICAGIVLGPIRLPVLIVILSAVPVQGVEEGHLPAVIHPVAIGITRAKIQGKHIGGEVVVARHQVVGVAAEGDQPAIGAEAWFQGPTVARATVLPGAAEQDRGAGLQVTQQDVLGAVPIQGDKVGCATGHQHVSPIRTHQR